MTLDELYALPVTVDVVTAGRAHGIGRTLAYEMARAGEFPCPVKRRGGRWTVRLADLLHSLGLDPPAGSTSPSLVA